MRQKGSHVMLTKPAYQWTLSVPQHDEIGPGLLRKLLKQAGLTVEEFNKL
jgi:predicted RNA binding protein YcfA (HicA-like mRNA interferase family)